MYFKPTVFAGVALLFLCAPLRSEVIITKTKNSITAKSTKIASAGYKGCDDNSLKEMPAYIFELQYLSTGSNSSPHRSGTSCPTGEEGKWLTYQKQDSDNGFAMFESLPKGVYRVLSLAAEPIGCEIISSSENKPIRSVVYAAEFSSSTSIGVDISENSSLLSSKRNIESISVYPNPAMNQLNISFANVELKEGATISIVDLAGKIVMSNVLGINKNINDTVFQVNVTKYPASTYFIVIRDRSGNTYQKKIVLIK